MLVSGHKYTLKYMKQIIGLHVVSGQQETIHEDFALGKPIGSNSEF